MKKIALVTGLILALGTASSAQAATLGISPTTLQVVEGQTVTVTVSADPAGEKLYTVKTVLSYPADLLEAKSFTFSNGLLSLSQPGYDSMGNGTIIKTAGVSGGFTSTRTVGTATFTAKKAGVATIAVQSTSLVLDGQSKNKLSGTQGSSVVTIAAPQPTEPTPTPVTPTATVATTATGQGVSQASVPAQTRGEQQVVEAVATTTEDGSSLLAAAEGAGTDIPVWVYAVLAAVVLLGGGAWWFLRRKTPVV